MNMDYQEGYCDGLAGAGLQDRLNDFCGMSYDAGFEHGSLDRKPMLANAERVPC